MPSKSLKPILVEWIDSCEPAVNSDITEDEFPSPQVIQSLGWLAFDGSTHIVLAGAVKEDAYAGRTYDYVISIPVVAIIKREEVRLVGASP
tara:strand:- start:185 stop:457 length:273 start_codon:yes stop_codon:yes gene_type:complete